MAENEQLVEETTSTDSQETQVQPLEQKVEATESKETPSRREQRQSKEKNYEKMYNDQLNSNNHWRSTYDKKFSTQEKELKELRALKQYEGILKEAAEWSEKQKLAELKKTDPDAYQQKLIDKAIAEKMNTGLPPEKQQDNPNNFDINTFTPEQKQQYAVNVENYLKQTFGAEEYAKYEPEMVRLVTETKANPEEYKALARRPDVLFRLAVADTVLKGQSQIKQQQSIEAQKNQDKAIKFAQGSAKPYYKNTKESKNPNELSDDDLIKQHIEGLRRR